jgi:hypothetical protein
MKEAKAKEAPAGRHVHDRPITGPVFRACAPLHALFALSRDISEIVNW